MKFKYILILTFGLTTIGFAQNSYVTQTPSKEIQSAYELFQLQKFAAAKDKFDQLKDPEENFGKWMMVIARYEIMSFRRKAEKIDVPLCDKVMQKILDQGAKEYDTRKELCYALQACIQKLKAGERELLDVAYNSSTSIKDFAKGNNKTTQSLYQKLNRIRTALTSCVQLQMKAESL